MKNNWIITFIFVCIFAGNSAGIVLANEEDDDAKKSKRGSWFSSLFEDDDDDDDDEHGERRRSSGKQGSKMSPDLASISAAPPEFEIECGSCHMAYQPELLPAVSWEKIMSGLEDHFGEDAAIDAQTQQLITSHLVRFSAEKSDSRLSRRKIMRSLGNKVYLRISEIPKLKREHSEHISTSVLKRPAIRSIANCAACHIPAVQGEYDEDYVRIPR